MKDLSYHQTEPIAFQFVSILVNTVHAYFQTFASAMKTTEDRIVIKVRIECFYTNIKFIIIIVYSRVACPPGQFGEFCTETCQCENGSPCDPYDGRCKCLTGWIGRDCSEKCSPHNFGIDCLEECPCKNGAICHHVTGKCDCPPGFSGPL